MARLVVFNSSDIKHDIERLRKGFAELPPGLARIHIRAAMKRAMQPYIPMFKAAAPRRTGSLRRSVTTVTHFEGVSGRFQAAVGYGRGRGKRGHHAILVADGTRKRITRNGANRGVMPSDPTVRGLASRIRAAAPPEFAKEMGNALQKAVNSLAKYVSHSRSGRG